MRKHVKGSWGVDNLVTERFCERLERIWRSGMTLLQGRHVRLLGLLVIGLLLAASFAQAQTTVTGEITGTVLDQSGAVVPDAKVILGSTDTGYSSTQTTGPSGTFRFSLLKPGRYSVTISAPAFATAKINTESETGKITELKAVLQMGAVTETIEVSAPAPLVQTTNANLTTTVTSATAQAIPNPGQDITNLALTAPGVSISTGAGYGNFSANGLPGTSNLFTVNGADYNDPSNNLANSGASNMTLGTNELQEATVVVNGYSGEYGRGAGANLNYSTKSGTNQFHGNAIWYWNGDALNANDWFSNAGGSPRPHAVSNQWAGSIGGPIVKDKLFFFYDNEGSRYVLPGGGTNFAPTTAYANAVMANLATNGAPAAVKTLYQTMFSLYAGAPGLSLGKPIAYADDANLGCGDFSGSLIGTTQFGGAANATACAQQFQSSVNSLNTERLMALTVDWNASDRDTLKFRWKQDRGVQATGTDPINAAFNANSNQPEWDAQVNWTHTFNSRILNQLIFSGLHYTAAFGPTNLAAALNTFPTTIFIYDGAGFANMGGNDASYPSGRRVGQYQIVDDFSISRGNHTIKMGVNFRRVNLADLSAGVNTSGSITMNSMTDFTNGVISAAGGSTFSQSFASANDVGEKNYSLGIYAQDEWRMTDRLKLTMAVRVDRNSPVACDQNCFTRLATQFQDLNHSALIPYSQAFALNQQSATSNLEAAVFEPRVGFSWSPTGKQDLVIRGGIGNFADLYPLSLASRFFTNLPNVTSIQVLPSSTNDNIWIAPAAPNSVFVQTAASNAALRSAITSGGTLATIKSAYPPFSPPTFNSIVNNFKNPKYLEWNLEIDKTFGGGKSLVSVGYAGNHGYDLVLQNYGLNAYCDPTNVKSTICSKGPFGSLPTAPVDSRFGRIREITNNGFSNYDGVTFGFKQQATKGLYGGATYTYFHSLDNISNGGFYPFNYSTYSAYNGGGGSIYYQIDPYNTKSPNYGNSDYDYRHTFSAYYVWALPFKHEGALGDVIGGWNVSGTFIVRGGTPFSVVNSGIRSLIQNGSSITTLADYLGGPMTCSASAATTPCLSASNFVSKNNQQNYPGAVFGNLGRNSFRGPGYFDADMSLTKDIKVKESMTFTIGANAYNVLNHPNFDNPMSNLNLSTSFGKIYATVGSPNSPYGNFTGAIVNGRILQLVVKFKF